MVPPPESTPEPRSSVYLCEYCKKEFSTKSSLDKHQKIHLGPPGFSCTLCTYLAYKRSYLENHIRTHTKEKPFKCPHPNCAFACSQSSTLTSHQLVHKKREERVFKFKCPVSGCAFKATTNGVMKKHSLIHSDVKPWSCDLCPYRAKTKGHIKIHYQNIHSTEKPFKCPEPSCNFSCKHRGALNQHVLRHSDERPFLCSFQGCGYRAKEKDTLKRHERIHREEKPFKCSFCNSSFRQKCVLVRHIRVHTGETPYSCPSCSYKAKQSSDLTTHMKKMHNLAKNSGKDAGSKPKAASSQSQMKFYKCQVLSCDYSTLENVNLALHLNAVHSLPKVILAPCQSPV